MITSPTLDSLTKYQRELLNGLGPAPKREFPKFEEVESEIHKIRLTMLRQIRKGNRDTRTRGTTNRARGLLFVREFSRKFTEDEIRENSKTHLAESDAHG